MLRVYVAGPLSTGGYYQNTVNIRSAIDVGEQLLVAGYAPYVPHYSHFWHLFHQHSWEQWMAYDKEMLSACHVLLRLPGESKGADQEVAWAHEMGIPVANSVEELNALRESRSKESPRSLAEATSRAHQ